MDEYTTAPPRDYPRPQARPIISRPLPESRPSSHGPISRSYLRAAKSPFRIIAGALFIGYSSIATIRFVNADVSPVLSEQVWAGMSAGYVLGFVLALAITIWEWLAADESWGWYAVPLAIDSWYTYRLTIPWMLPLVAVHASDKATATTIAIIISVVGAIAVALFGERLLFGKRH